MRSLAATVFLGGCMVAMTPVPSIAGRLVLPEPGDEVEAGQFVIKLRRGASAAGAEQVAARSGATLRGLLFLRNRTWLRLRLASARQETLLREIAAHPDVDLVEPNRVRRTTVLNSNDPSVAAQWGLTAVGALRSWAIAPGHYLSAASPGVNRIRVAVLDTGADCTHPDFINAGGNSTNVASGGQINWVASAAISATTLASPACVFQDDHGHGTHVAGIAAAATNNATGVASLGFGTELLIYKVLDNTGSASDVDIATGIVNAVDAGAKVVSMSLGGFGYSQMLQDAVNYAWARNVFVVAAAGNSNSTSLFFPAGADHAFAVGAFESSGLRASYSNRGMSLDISAPGTSIYSLLPTYSGGAYSSTNYGSLSGTSMAAPFVSALGGLLLSIAPGLVPDAVGQRIQRSASPGDAADGGWSPNFGYGKIHAENTLTGLGWRAAATGGITGQVRDEDGVAIDGATVAIGSSSAAVPSGLFRIGGLAPGTHMVTISASGYTSVTYSVNVMAGADTNLSAILGAPTGRFTGTVTSGGSPLNGAVVQALSAGLVVATAITDSNGGYQIIVPAGQYTLEVSAFGHTPAAAASTVYTLSGGSNQTANLSMKALGRITGLVRNGSSGPVADAQIAIAGPQLETGTLSSSDGSYATPPLADGSYESAASSPGLPTSTFSSVNVTGPNNTVVDFTLGVGTPLTITPGSVGLGPNQVQQFTAVASGLPDNQVTWSITPTGFGSLTSAGRYTAPFSISSTQVLTLRATSVHQGSIQATATITIGNPLNLFLHSPVGGGGTTTSNRVLLTAPAPAGGAAVELSSSDPVASVPAVVTVPAGETSVYFNIQSDVVTSQRVVTISARYQGIAKTALLTLDPLSVASLYLGGSSLQSGKSTGLANLALNTLVSQSATVTLSSSDPVALPVPESVTVPGGSNRVYFSLTGGQVSVPTEVIVTATVGGLSRTASITITPAGNTTFLAGLTVASSLPGGIGATGRLDLNEVAGPGGATVQVTSSVPQLMPSPGAVLVPQGQMFVTFPILPEAVVSNQAVTLTATFGQTRTATVTILAPVLSALSTVPSMISGTSATANSIQISGVPPAAGFPVLLSATPEGVLTLPPSVSVGASGTASFTMTAGTITTITQVTIHATANGIERTAQVTVSPENAPTLVITPGSASLGPNQTRQFSVTATGLPNNQVTWSRTPAVGSITSAGLYTAPFSVSGTQTVTIRAVSIHPGAVEATATITLSNPLNLYLQSPVGGGTVTTSNRVILTSPAPPGGAVVDLASSDSAAVVAASVTVPAGQTSVYFPIETQAVAAQRIVLISASYQGVTKAGTLVLDPLAVTSLYLGTSSLRSGQTTGLATVSLNAPVAAATTVALVSSDPVALPVPATVTVPVGANRVYFAITGGQVTTSTQVTVTATLGASSRTATILITPP